ncbi:MAG: DUF933 domain-containing protein, partial [Planctomycetota bacterium]
LADLQTVENAKKRFERTARSGDKEAKHALGICEKLEAAFNAGTPGRAVEFADKADRKIVRELQLITTKTVLYVANVGEDDLAGEHELVDRVRERAKAEGTEVVPVCAQLEAELAELEDEDRAEMLADVGLDEPALAVLARAAYRTLGLQSYFTAGEKEIRAWTVPVGATAPQAAGVIHSDFERGFIRVETYGVDDLDELATEKAIREAGRMRVEGKDYVMRDGDVCHFLFNV